MKSVQEAKADLKIEFEERFERDILPWVDPGSSVAVRDKNNAVKYLG